MSTQIFDGNIQLPGYKKPTSIISVATILSIYQSGRIFNFIDPTGAIQITLPIAATAAGVNYRFQIIEDLAQDITIRPVANNNLLGICSTPAGITSGGNSVLTFEGLASIDGDFAEVYCDGTRWSVMAVSSVNAGVTLA